MFISSIVVILWLIWNNVHSTNLVNIKTLVSYKISIIKYPGIHGFKYIICQNSNFFCFTYFLYFNYYNALGREIIILINQSTFK